MSIQRVAPERIVVSTSEDAFRITQTGRGNAFVVEDSDNPDSTPFVIDRNGVVTATSINSGYDTTATAAGTTTLSAGSKQNQFFTGTTTQNVNLPVASTLTLGHYFIIHNNSTGVVTVRSSGVNTILAMPGGTSAQFTCILASGTSAASWAAEYVGNNGVTGTGSFALAVSPTFTGTPAAPTAAAGTNTTQIATTAFVSTAVSNLLGAAPATLDTLNELATALGNDANFATSVFNAIDLKVAKAGDSMTGNLSIDVNNSSPALRVSQNGTGNIAEFEDVTTPDSSPFVINATGKVIIGRNGVAGSWFTSSSSSSSLYVVPDQSIGNNGGVWVQNHNSTSLLTLARSSGASVGDRLIVSNGDIIGEIHFAADDGNNGGHLRAAHIRAQVDGVPGVGSMPGRLTFLTTPSGSGTGSERMRITSAGDVGIGSTNPGQKLDVVGNIRTTNQFISTLATGTSPLSVVSTTVVTNLNADLLDGQQGTYYLDTSATAQTKTGNLTINGNLTVDTNTLFVDSANDRVGSGTITPSNKLHIFGAGGTSPATVTSQALLYLQDSGAVVGNGGGILFGANQGSFAQIKGFIQNGSTNTIGDLSFATRNAVADANLTERMRITNAGRVGIGTAAPSTLKSGTIHVSALTSEIRIESSDNATGTPNSLLTLKRAAARSAGIVFSDLADAEVAFVGIPYNGGSPADMFVVRTAGNEHVRVTSSGNVGIGTTTPGFKLQVNGSFAATTKSFIIDHPTKEGMSLRYGSLEGPENGVYVRGKGKVGAPVELPDYWTGLVDSDSITVQVTPVGTPATLYVSDISNNTVTISGGEEGVEFFYFIQAERVDVDKLVVEYDSQV